MKSKLFNNILAVRLNRGEEIVSSIEKLCKEYNIKSGTIQAIGACDKIKIGLYEVEKRTYISTVIEKELELINLMGNISQKDEKLYLHLHAAFGDEKGNAFGGHLNEAVISGTCEIFINIIDGFIDRIFDDETGLNIIDF